MDNQWWSSPIVSVRTRMLNITGMLLQSHCGDEEDGRIGLSSGYILLKTVT